MQPASLTVVGGAYTDNDSKALALLQQNYWNRNNWRFTGVIAATDYFGTASVSGQLEARWRATTRWGFVGFAGTGYSRVVYSEQNDRV